MSSATIERILNEVKSLTPAEQRELREALDREAQSASHAPVGENRRDSERRWLDVHRDEYLGQWVALEGARLLASGEDARALYSAARVWRSRSLRDARRAARRIAVRRMVSAVPHGAASMPEGPPVAFALATLVRRVPVASSKY